MNADALPPSPRWAYSFGPFRLDPERGLLTCGADVVPLPERLFKILVALLRANGTVLSREELTRLIWPEGIAADNNLSQHVYMLRRILGERASDRLYIMTVHNKGFRFVAPISVVPPETNGHDEPLHQRPKTTADELLRSGLRPLWHYTAGWEQIERGHASALQKAVDHFTSALAIDAEYAPALVGLAQAHMLLSINEYAPRQSEFCKAKDAIIRALKIDPSSAGAHAVLASITLYCDWNWAEATREIDMAIGLGPDNGLVHRNAAYVYEWGNLPEQALLAVQRAIAIEPTSLSLQVLLGRLLARRGDNAAAIAHYTNLIDARPAHHIIVRRHRAEILIINGQYSDALLDLLMTPSDRVEDLSWRLRFLCLAYAGSGDSERAREVYDILIENARTEYVASRNLVAPALTTGDRGAALRFFERSLREAETSLPILRLSPTVSAICDSIPFKSLIKAIRC